MIVLVNLRESPWHCVKMEYTPKNALLTSYTEWGTYMKIWETDYPPANVGSSPILFIFSGRNDCAVKLRDHVSSTFINFLINWRWWHSNLWELLYKSFCTHGEQASQYSLNGDIAKIEVSTCVENQTWNEPSEENNQQIITPPMAFLHLQLLQDLLWIMPWPQGNIYRKHQETTGLPCSVSWVGGSPTSAVEQGWGLVTMGIWHQVYQHSPSGLFCLCS
jgi:hypothetical protein